ncbi:hypothetical protein L227DRAFT_627838 [Lentinus tigrinus ALCF2SS1-6]|uniref:Ferric oxidoreductase domain-containing protein n=1 Tax=Lentinus tigrinus ALCF2SS1-6 TaxID=1328759 RepID=A0A5C2RLW3_9APHY|nr:hypothetical protein L227DRAFT_627838 [Lentinus tigrinus ALCF2SS1-6]
MAKPRFTAKDKAVFASIFHADGECRQDISWKEYVKAMGHLGFSIGPCGKTGGSGRGFIAPSDMGNRRMRLDNPHGPRDGTLRAADQTSLIPKGLPTADSNHKLWVVLGIVLPQLWVILDIGAGTGPFATSSIATAHLGTPHVHRSDWPAEARVASNGALWINNHQKEISGVAASGVLCVLVLTLFRPIRRFFYQWFFVVHVLGFVAFCIAVCYHTIYASPWIFPPLAFYGFDMLLRMFRYRIKDATLVPVDSNMILLTRYRFMSMTAQTAGLQASTSASACSSLDVSSSRTPSQL